MTLNMHISSGNLTGLAWDCRVLFTDGAPNYELVRESGFRGVQHRSFDQAVRNAGLELSGLARITSPSDAIKLARRHADMGFVATTLHVGTGMETDSEASNLAESVLTASLNSEYPLFIETHRATITQDMRRTLNLIDRFPELRFTADLSHWYSGLEMRYGDWTSKLDALARVFERVRFIHGRIGNSCCMQVPLDVARSGRAWMDFGELWRRCFLGFQSTSTADEQIFFAPELLPAKINVAGDTIELNYALDLGRGELSDRWTEALELRDYAQSIFTATTRAPETIMKRGKQGDITAPTQ